MRRFLLSEEECAIAMSKGVLDMLTVVDHGFVKRCIKWVKLEIRRCCAEASITYSKVKWRGFWGYFNRTWIEQYDVTVWNVAGLNNELIARTNNPLERFNRELNKHFPKPRPSMAIKTISTEYVQRLADIHRGRARRPLREVIQLPKAIEIPEDIGDDSEDEAPVVTEQLSDSSSDEGTTEMVL